MTPEEIEEKMNLDEATCCPRRSKRRRRRLESISEEEDETSIPKVNGIPVAYAKRKVKKMKPAMYTNQIMCTDANGTVIKQLQSYSNQPIPIRPRPIALLSGQFNQTEAQQTVINQKERTNSSNLMVPSTNMINSTTSLSSNSHSNVLQKQTPYRTTFMNAIGSNPYMQPSTAINTAHQIILPSQASVPMQSQTQLQSQSISYQPSQSISYQPQTLQSSLNTMVSIPNSMSQYKSRILFSKQKKSNVTLIPNIIELDSDSDEEPKVVDQPNVSTANRSDISVIDIASNKVVPVALAWDEDIREEQPLRIMEATEEKNVESSFKEIMLPHSRELDKLLSDVKEKVYSFFDLNGAIEDIELAAEQKIKQYYHSMCNTVLQLTHINDRVVREYNDWIKSRKTKTDVPSSTDLNARASQENDIDISLDMTCVNDSDTESDCEINDQIKESSDVVKNSNIVKTLLFCKKNVVHRGVGNDSVQFTDKTTQMYDVSRDYDNCISHCVLTKANQHSKADDNVLEPVAPDKNFGKYEEQFIFYLQQIEDHGIETEDTKENLDNLVETLVQEEQTETNSPQLLENITSIDQPTIYEQETNLKNSASLAIKDGKIDASINIVDKDKIIVDNSDFDIRIKDINILNDTLQETEPQKIYSEITDTDVLSNISNNDAMNSSQNITDKINMEIIRLFTSTGSEEDCTIIDD